MQLLPGIGSFTNAVTVTPADGTNQRYLAFMCAVGGTIAIRPETAAADSTLTIVAGSVYPISVTAIRATGTTATGIIGLS